MKFTTIEIDLSIETEDIPRKNNSLSLIQSQIFKDQEWILCWNEEIWQHFVYPTLLSQQYEEIIPPNKDGISEFRGGRRKKQSDFSKTIAKAAIEFKYFSPSSSSSSAFSSSSSTSSSPSNTINIINCAIIQHQYSFHNLSQLPEFKKNIIEILLPFLTSQENTVLIVTPSRICTITLMTLLSLTHPQLTYTTHMKWEDFLFIQTVINESMTRFVVNYFTNQQQEQSFEPRTGEDLEQFIQYCIQKFLDQVGSRAIVSEPIQLFFRRIIFAIIKERKQKKNLQSFRSEIISQLNGLKSPLVPIQDYEETINNKKRKFDGITSSSSTVDKHFIGHSNQSRIVKPMPLIEEGLSVFEFFSGIGGMRLALPKIIRGIPINRITAFDINRIANQIYEYNFHERKIDSIPNSILRTCVIESLKPEDVDGKSDIWTMSPPCQPFTTTRGANRKDHLDNRSKGLYHIMYLLLSIQSLPRWIVLENVKGFIGSEMYQLWLKVIQSCGYEYQEYLLSPETAVGIPNARKRYYFIAELNEATTTSSAINDNFPQFSNEKNDFASSEQCNVDNTEEHEEPFEKLKSSEKAEDTMILFTENTINTSLPASVQSIYSLSYSASSSSLNQAVTLREIFRRRISEAEWLEYNTFSDLIVPMNILEASWAKKHLSLVDISSRLSYCFTKGYGKLYDHSAGSCLFLARNSTISHSPSAHSEMEESIIIDRDRLPNYYPQIRLFHPNELLVLFGFPNEYSFPSSTMSLNLLHQYGCIGNSVNITVVKAVMHCLFKE